MSFRRYRSYKTDEFIICAVDTAWGGKDYCVAQFLSKDNLDVPVVYHKQQLASEMTPLIHHELEKIYDETGLVPVVAYERQNGGIAEIERLITLNRKQKYRVYQQKTNVGTDKLEGISPKYGFDTNSATRPTMLAQLKEAIDNKLIRIYDKPTVTEMFSFVVKQKTGSWKAEAEVGAHDDLIMALSIAWQLYQTENKPESFDDYVPQYQAQDFSV